jgi:hypothetical protein
MTIIKHKDLSAYETDEGKAISIEIEDTKAAKSPFENTY